MHISMYSASQIHRMNYGETWRNCISTPASTTTSTSPRYELHATGYADLNGRKYVALPSGTKLTPDLKKKLNIW